MILDETLKRIKQKTDLSNVAITDIYLNKTFSIIRLNNGANGVAMNYFKFSSEEIKKSAHHLFMKKLKSDPLLLNYLFNTNSRNLLKLNLKVALLSALSKGLIKDCKKFKITKNIDEYVFDGINSAVVIGFGGYMDLIITKTKIKNIHISDLFYDNRKMEIDKKISEYKNKFPDKMITVSNGIDNKQKMESSELVSITGSAFCNGTMDSLLDYSKNCKKIIIQGNSANIYPEVLFEKGVSLVATIDVSEDLIALAEKDEEKLQDLVEDDLSTIYIYPKL